MKGAKAPVPVVDNYEGETLAVVSLETKNSPEEDRDHFRVIMKCLSDRSKKDVSAEFSVSSVMSDMIPDKDEYIAQLLQEFADNTERELRCKVVVPERTT